MVRQITRTGIGYLYYNDGSHITDTRVDSAGLDGSWAVSMEGGRLERTTVTGSGGDGIRAVSRYASVQISDCAVSGSKGDGIRVAFRTVRTLPINRCNIHDNGGVGVVNLSDFEVDATGNWWGDPAGPNGPQGDGVSGAVDFGAFLTELVEIGAATAGVK